MILDLFAGAGGWSEGLRMIGLSDIGLEWDDAACRTRAAAGHLTVRCDVAGYPMAPFVGRVRGLIASPPCQAWSMAGKGKGRGEVDRVHAAVELCRGGWTDEALAWDWADPRTALILQPLRWAWDLRPEWIACEQVPPGLGVWQHMADVFRSWGYASGARILCAADYGVPQTRDRAFLLATTGKLRWPEPTHAEKPEPSLFGAGLKPWVTMATALGWEPGSRAWDRRVGGFAADAEMIEDDRPAPTVTLSHGRDVWRVRTSFGEPHRGKEAGSPKPEFNPIERPCRTVCSKTGDWTVTRPATTVQADPRVGRPGHKDRSGGEAQFAEGSVRITIEEAATLQGFATPYPWQGTRSAQYQQVGNAVCPPVSAAIVGALEASIAKQPARAA